jgi:hypothetical protein
MEKFTRFTIRFWLAFAIASFIWACIQVYQLGWDKGWIQFYIPGIALIWYFFRLKMYQRMKRQQ